MNYNNEFRKYAVHHLGMSGNTVDSYAQQINNMTQYVIEERPGNFRAIDVFTRLDFRSDYLPGNGDRRSNR